MNEKNEEEYRVKVVYDQDGERVLSEYWYNTQNKNHRLGDQPAITRYNGNGDPFDQHWMVNGVYHRQDGPAMITTDSKSGDTVYQWMQNGELHRDGKLPAFVVVDKNGQTLKSEWFIHGERFTKRGLVYKGPS